MGTPSFTLDAHGFVWTFDQVHLSLKVDLIETIYKQGLSSIVYFFYQITVKQNTTLVRDKCCEKPAYLLLFVLHTYLEQYTKKALFNF